VASVSVLGKGNMGSAISDLARRSGHDVEVLDSSDGDKPVTGDIVVLAVPYPALDAILDARREQLAGKVVVDITNPLNFETYDSLTVPADGSAAAELAARLPDSKVVKAFNTNFAATLAAGTVGGRRTTVLVAADDADAKTAVRDLVTGAGLQALDAGPLRRARELEALGFLQITMAAASQIPWDGGFTPVT
jgi:NADPH-dependent F420 reductase